MPEASKSSCADAEVDAPDESEDGTHLAAIVATLLGLAAVALLLHSCGVARSVVFSRAYLVQVLFFGSACAGSFLIFVLTTASRRDRLMGACVGALATLLILPPGQVPWVWSLNALGVGLGFGAIAVTVWRVIGASGAARREELRRLAVHVMLPLFVAVSATLLQLTMLLRPVTLDGTVYLADLHFGIHPSFDMGRFFEAVPWLSDASLLVYAELPLWLALIYALRARAGLRPQQTLDAFTWMAVVGYAIYFMLPVVGPAYAIAGFPNHPPLPSSVEAAAMVPALVPRNAMPSLHVAWALLIFWHARPLPRWARALTFSMLALTILATLGFGYHYLVDLLFALPLAVLIQALVQRRAPRRARRHALFFGAAAAEMWVMLTIGGQDVLALSPVIPWLLATATVALGFHFEARLWTKSPQSGNDEGQSPADEHAATRAPSPAPARAATSALDWALAGIFFVSGGAALVYQVAFAKSLGLSFGSTGRAQAVVLATYMAGLALGNWLGGRLAKRIRRPLRAYAFAELGIAAWCVLAPVTLSAGQALYVLVATGTDPAAGWLVWLQLALGALLLMPPTFLMGLTLPLLTGHFTRQHTSLGIATGLLYAANTLGAAVAALTTGYLLLPLLGVRHAFWVGVVLNILAASTTLLLFRRTVPEPRPGEETAPAAAAPADDESPEHERPSRETRRLGQAAVLSLAVGGVVTFGLESTYTHLLAVVAGNSAYAFSLMLFSFLLGLGGGAAAARRWLMRGLQAARALAVGQALLAASVLIGVYMWAGIPHYFATFFDYPGATTFPQREFVRFVVCALTMIPPATVIGALYPIAMELVGRAWPHAKIRALGTAAALNTVGNVVGALLTGFVLLPSLGALGVLHVLTATSLGLGAAVVWACPTRARRVAAGSVLAGLLLLAVQPRSFDLTALSSGANVYFAMQGYGHVIDHAESVDGGLTTVAESHGVDGTRVRTLLTNGKFQGDDSGHREMAAQSSFALVPLLHTQARGTALVIGLGTGVSANVISQAGFRHLDVAELSSDIVDLTSRYFANVNGRVLARDGVSTHITDGRNYLMLTENRYDLISIEITSIWFAGAASLYDSEFYQLVSDHLDDHGVFQQWIQLHHISTLDITRILATIHHRFRFTWLYFVGRQGIIVACNHDCAPTQSARHTLEREPGLASTMALFQGDLSAIVRGLVLDTNGVEALIRGAESHGHARTDLLATDDNLLLEYSTPRGNVDEYAESMRRSLRFLQPFRVHAPSAAPAVRDGP